MPQVQSSLEQGIHAVDMAGLVTTIELFTDGNCWYIHAIAPNAAFQLHVEQLKLEAHTMLHMFIGTSMRKGYPQGYPIFRKLSIFLLFPHQKISHYTTQYYEVCMHVQLNRLSQ